MEEPKERELVIYGECAKCKNLVRIDIKLKTALANEKTEEKPEEEKPSAEGEKPGTSEAADKGSDLRPSSDEGPSPGESAGPKPSDSGKNKGTRKPKGK